MKYIIWMTKGFNGKPSDEAYYKPEWKHADINNAFGIMNLIYKVANGDHGNKYELEIRECE